MKNAVLIFLVFLNSGCFKKDIESKTFSKDDLKEDLKIFKGIVTDMHAGAYTYNTTQELNAVFDSVNNSITEDLTLIQFYKKIDYLVDKIKCIHTNTYLPNEFLDSIKTRALFFSAPLMAIDNKLYVNSNTCNIPLGAEILYINNIRASTIISKLKKFEHTDGNSNVVRNRAIDSYFALNYYLEYGGFEEFKIQYLLDSSSKSITNTFKGEKLEKINTDNDYIPYTSIPTDVNYDLEIPENGAFAIFSIRSFYLSSNNEKTAFYHFLENSFDLIKQKGTKNIILDCRENTGGFYDVTYPFLSYLVNKKLPEYDSAFQRFDHLTYTQYVTLEDSSKVLEEDTSYLKYDKIENNLFKLKHEEIIEWEPNKNLFEGNIYVIINGNVVSAGSTFAAILQDKTNAIIVGEETGGSNDVHNASTITFELPSSKIKIDIPLRKYYQPIVKKNNGRGVIPNKIFNYTQRDLIDGADKPLDYILDSLIK